MITLQTDRDLTHIVLEGIEYTVDRDTRRVQVHEAHVQAAKALGFRHPGTSDRPQVEVGSDAQTVTIEYGFAKMSFEDLGKWLLEHGVPEAQVALLRSKEARRGAAREIAIATPESRDPLES